MNKVDRAVGEFLTSETAKGLLWFLVIIGVIGWAAIGVGAWVLFG